MLKDNKEKRRIPLEGPILVAHQAEFLPYLGFISKATMGDIYFILDDSQYKKENFTNRNRIRIHNDPGWMWLTVPVKYSKNNILNAQDAYIVESKWKKKHLKTIEFSYSKSPFFNQIFPDISKLYENDAEKLVDFNYEIIKYAFNYFEINIPVFRTSEINKKEKIIFGKSTDLILSMCDAAEAKTFIAGAHGKYYIDVSKFKQKNINLVFQNFIHPEYKQHHGSFIPFMAFIDLIFNHSRDECIDIVGKSGYESS